MKKRTSIFLIFAIALTSCSSLPKVGITFSLHTNSNNTKSLRVNFVNNSNQNIIILNMSRVEKLRSQHPCKSNRLDDFTKISSHKNGDCNINMGSRLFVYQKIEPFDKTEYIELKEELINLPWFKEKEELFNYMEPSNSNNYQFPSFILIEAGQTVAMEYLVDGSLSKIDKGEYTIYWASQEEIENTLSPKNDNKYKLGEALSNTKKYKLYDGPIKVDPYIFTL